jgi:hypothetical protein
MAALGTRGDVQPLAVLALYLQQAFSQRVQVHLITNAAHASWLSSGPYAQSHYTFHYVDLPPAAAPGQLTASALTAPCTAVVEYIQRALQGHERALILFNLFTLEAWSAAELLRVPCIATSPYCMPRQCPAAFKTMFEGESLSC